MRIALVQAGLGAGGTEKIVNMLARHWSRKHEVRLLVLDGGPSYFDYPPEIRIEAAPHATGGARPTRRLRDVMWLRERLGDFAPAATLSFLTKVNAMTALATRGRRGAFIPSERNNPRAQGTSWPWRVGADIAAMAADAVVMQTRAAREALPRRARARALVIANPAEVPAAAWDGQPPDAPNRFVAVGRLDQQKGFDLLVEAFALHVARGPADGTPDRLTIHGEGPERVRLEALIRERGLDDRIDLPGRTERPGAWLARGGTFVLPSRFEGFPNVLVEALAAGLPAVAFDCPWGPSELIDGNNGILVPAGDVEALADAMTRVARDADLRGRLAAAAATSVAPLSPERILALWDEALATALARRNSR